MMSHLSIDAQGCVLCCAPDTEVVTQEGGKERTCELIDIPGHAKVRGTATQFYSAAKAVLFLVDAVDFMAQKTSVAEHLYEVDFTQKVLARPLL